MLDVCQGGDEVFCAIKRLEAQLHDLDWKVDILLRLEEKSAVGLKLNNGAGPLSGPSFVHPILGPKVSPIKSKPVPQSELHCSLFGLQSQTAPRPQTAPQSLFGPQLEPRLQIALQSLSRPQLESSLGAQPVWRVWEPKGPALPGAKKQSDLGSISSANV